MVLKKSFLIGLGLSILLLLSFFIGYKITLQNVSKASLAENQSKDKVKETFSIKDYAITQTEERVREDTKFVFKVEYTKGEESINENKQVNINTMLGKNKKGLEEIYGNEGYIIKEMDSKHVLLVKSFDRYAPNKYVIDIYKEANCVAIFKTDEQGRESIEEPDKDIKFQTKISDLKDGDLDIMLQGKKCLQFDNKDDAEENYKVIFTT